MKNYIKLEDKSLLYYHYVYVDAVSYLADELFIQEKVRVHFGKEAKKEGYPYHVIFCKVRKKNEEKFLSAMEQLNKKMLLLGHSDYMDICEFFFSEVTE